MKKKKGLIFIIALCVIILPILIYNAFSFQSSMNYEISEPAQRSAKTLKDLVVLLLQNEEAFSGLVNVTYIDGHKTGLWNKAEIHVLNNTIYDDSIGAVEYIAIAEKKGELWKLTNYKSHWKCSRYLFFNSFWTTSACP